MQTIINKLYEQQGLTQAESQQLFDQIIRGEMDPVLMAAVLTALKIKGETPDEIAGAAKALLANANPFPRPDYDFADIVGTYGRWLKHHQHLNHRRICRRSVWRESRQTRQPWGIEQIRLFRSAQLIWDQPCHERARFAPSLG